MHAPELSRFQPRWGANEPKRVNHLPKCGLQARHVGFCTPARKSFVRHQDSAGLLFTLHGLLWTPYSALRPGYANEIGLSEATMLHKSNVDYHSCFLGRDDGDDSNGVYDGLFQPTGRDNDGSRSSRVYQRKHARRNG
uniref:Uncharacterized protein n=1 Tax=Mycena chlorophos TaxID=658473 RepID=A0ABQ0LBX2_MYCCL|nr:predicted protein [Mycena chlorophos]